MTVHTNKRGLVLQIGIGIAIFVLGFIGEIHIGVPWWSGITFLTAGILLIVLVVKQLQILEVFAFAATIISILVAIAGIIFYILEFSLYGTLDDPYVHDTASDRALLLSYTVDCVILALLAFELGLSIWILSSFVYANKKTRHASRQPKA
ncbi:uncharacterized protein LOC144827620 isoform X2 [Lissotriton helveticus]